MVDSFWKEVRDEQYRESSGEAERQRKRDERDERRRDEHLRDVLGDDCPPNPFSGR